MAEIGVGHKHQSKKGKKMAKFKHLSKNKFNHVRQNLLQIENGLSGLGALFEDQGATWALSQNELFGIGQIIKLMGHQLSIQNDILDCGYDSKAITKTSPKIPKKPE